MGKIILEFDSFEESEDARVALDGYKWKLAMWDLDQKLRSTAKHGYRFYENTEATGEERDLCDKLRQEIRNILEQYNLNLED